MAQTTETNSGLPRPGHGWDLHEWAQTMDEQAEEALKQDLSGAQHDVEEFVAGLVGDQTLAIEAKTELDGRLERVVKAAFELGAHTHGLRLGDIYDGEALNS